jgi:hypothetical protein
MRAMAGLQLERGLVDPLDGVFENAAVLLLGLAERLFRGLPGGDVAGDAEDAYRCPAKNDRLHAHVQRDAPAVLREDLQLLGSGSLIREQLSDQLPGLHHVLRNYDLDDVHPESLFAGVPDKALCCAVHGDDVSVEIRHADYVGHTFEELTVPPLAHAQRVETAPLAGSPAVGDAHPSFLFQFQGRPAGVDMEVRQVPLVPHDQIHLPGLAARADRRTAPRTSCRSARRKARLRPAQTGHSHGISAWTERRVSPSCAATNDFQRVCALICRQDRHPRAGSVPLEEARCLPW